MSNTPKELVGLVLDKINELGDADARDYFGVSAGTISAWKSLKTFPSIVAAQKAWDESLLCQSPEVWSATGSESVCILLPVYETVEPFFMLSFLKALKQYGIERVNIIPKTRTLIEEARNDLVSRAMLTNAEWFIFADVDMILPCGNAAFLRKMGVTIPESVGNLNAITRLMSHPKEYRIVGSLYKDRRAGERVLCAKAFASPQENVRLLGLFKGETKPAGLEEAGGWVAPGWMRIHRSVFDEMLAEAKKPGSKMEEILPPPPPRDKEPVGYFGRTSRWRGEDVAFGRRAEMIGIKSWIDTSLLCGHVGRRVF